MSDQRPIIIGTAGHVDHGKTSLIRALTGVDTDRLKQEKERGISIKLGFAPLQLPDGRRAGVVDVPGHEKFIPQMLSGAASIDLVLLVIDATEGVMPQTREHLQILELLEVQRGLLVLNKIDLVEKEWLDIVEEEVREQVAGTFLAEAPCCRVSAREGRGLDELLAELVKVAAATPQRDTEGPVRLPIDRAFTLSGHGTVVTGTLVSGTVHRGDHLEILPAGLQARVRELQNHGRQVASAGAGQRLALNLAGAERGWFVSGSVAASPHRFCITERIDVRLRLLADAQKPLRFRDPIHFHLGTARAVGRIVLLEADSLEPGQSTLAQIVLDRPLAAWRGDPFVIRSYSPMMTIGGGRVLDAEPAKHKRLRREVLQRIARLESGDSGAVLNAVERLQAAKLREIEKRTGLSRERVQQALEELCGHGELCLLGEQWLVARLRQTWCAQIQERCRSLIEATPLAHGVGRASLKESLPAALSLKGFDLLVAELIAEGILQQQADRLAPAGWQPKISVPQRQQIDRLLTHYTRLGLQAPNQNQVFDDLQIDVQGAEALVAYLVGEGALVRFASDYLLSKAAYDEALRALVGHFSAQPELTLASYRDLMGIGRKLAQALLEHFDACKYTRRQGDLRLAWNLPQ